MIFLFVNLIKSFFQQDTKSIDWWKIIFVTSYREQKWLKISIMRLTNISRFFQYRMKNLLLFYLWQFVLIYIDNITIWSFSLNKYIQYLNQIFTLLKKSKMTLTFIKCHFAYFNIKTLEHYISRLRLNTIEKKINVIRQMRFSRNLRDFEVKLKFFDYYWFFINHFIAIVKSLIKLKTRDFINSSIKSKSRREYATRTKL